MVNKLIFANLAHRPVRTLLSILAIGVEVTMILTLVGVSYGTLDASARRARGIGADVFVRPPGSSAIGLSSAPLPEKIISVLGAKPGVVLAAGTMVQSTGGFSTIQGVDFPTIDKMASTWRGPGTPERQGFKFLAGGPFTGPDEVLLKREMQQEMAQMDAAHATLEPLLAPIDNAPIIQVRQLTKTFHVGEVDVHALQGIDLQVARGEFLSIIGTSGSGKSTLFNILGGLTPPSTGSVEINGRNLSQMNDTERNDLRKRTVGFVFQKYNLLPTLTAEQNIQIVRDVAGRPTAFDEHFKEILAMLGIEKRLQHKPRALSGGEQQRVAIARAIVNGPAILLADEPTGNLDSKNSDIVLNLLRDLNRRLGQTILMITHNPEAAAYADRTIQMRDGKVV